MKEQLISFETAKLAKEKDFPFIDNYHLQWYDKEGKLYYVQFPHDESLSSYFNKVYLKDNTLYNGINDTKDNPIVRYEDDLYLAPTQSLLQKWLREVHNIHTVALPWQDHAADNNDPIKYRGMIYGIKTYEEHLQQENAMEQVLFEGLKLIK